MQTYPWMLTFTKHISTIRITSWICFLPIYQQMITIFRILFSIIFNKFDFIQRIDTCHKSIHFLMIYLTSVTCLYSFSIYLHNCFQASSSYFQLANLVRLQWINLSYIRSTAWLHMYHSGGRVGVCVGDSCIGVDYIGVSCAGYVGVSWASCVDVCCIDCIICTKYLPGPNIT